MQEMTLATDLTLINAAAQQAIMTDRRRVPVGKVIVRDTDTEEEIELASVKSFTVRTSKRRALDSFQISLGQADAWNTRVLDWLKVDAAKRFEISFGYRVEGFDYLFLIYTGILQKEAEHYGGKSNSIVLNGSGLDVFLSDITGRREDYSGSAKALIIEYLTAAGLDQYNLKFDDFAVEFEQLNCPTGLMAIDTIIDTKPDMERFLTPDGTFTVQAIPGTGNYTFEYDGEINLKYLNPNMDARLIVNDCTVRGLDDVEASAEDAALIEKYGRKTRLYSRPLVQTEAECLTISEAIIEQSKKHENAVAFRVPANPYFSVSENVYIRENKYSGFESEVNIEAITLQFAAGERSEMNCQGYNV